MHVNVEYPEVILNIKDIKASIDAGDKVGDVLEEHYSNWTTISAYDPLKSLALHIEKRFSGLIHVIQIL